MWCTISCLPRLSLLPATMAYVYNPSPAVGRWYAVFLVATMGLMVFIHASGRKGLGWYFLWGWVTEDCLQEPFASTLVCGNVWKRRPWELRERQEVLVPYKALSEAVRPL